MLLGNQPITKNAANIFIQKYPIHHSFGVHMNTCAAVVVPAIAVPEVVLVIVPSP